MGNLTVDIRRQTEERTMEALIDTICDRIERLPVPERIAALNRVRRRLQAVSPLAAEPVDCVLWLPAEAVEANDYNPNTVAKPELKLLEHSIAADGYTQPVVTFLEETRREVVDGFHRRQVGMTSRTVRARTGGYLPVVTINPDRGQRADRIAATIRHNRARGVHQVAGMSEIVVELARRNWSDARIARELGMDADEVLRLKQVSGLAQLFADGVFSEAWE